MGMLNLQKGRLRQDLIHVCKHLLGRSREDGPKLFSLVPSERTRSNGPQTEIQEIPTQHQKKKKSKQIPHTFLLYRWSNTGLVLPREVMPSPALELEHPTGHIPEQPALADPALSRGSVRTISRDACQPQPFCGSVKRQKEGRDWLAPIIYNIGLALIQK